MAEGAANLSCASLARLREGLQGRQPAPTFLGGSPQPHKGKDPVPRPRSQQLADPMAQTSHGDVPQTSHPPHRHPSEGHPGHCPPRDPSPFCPLRFWDGDMAPGSQIPQQGRHTG